MESTAAVRPEDAAEDEEAESEDAADEGSGDEAAEEAAVEDLERAFDLVVPLKSGFNLVEARASYVPDGAAAYAAQVVVRDGPDALLAIGEVQQLGRLIRLFGVATPGAQIVLEGADFETTTTTSEQGRFVLNILPDTVSAGATVTVTATSPLGAVTRRELAIP